MLTFSCSWNCAKALGARSTVISQSPISSGAFAQRSEKRSLSSSVASRPMIVAGVSWISCGIYWRARSKPRSA